MDNIDSNLLSEAKIHRVQSDSNLNKTGRNVTMDDDKMRFQPDEIIARVFNALGSIKTAEEGINGSPFGFHGLSDSQILNSEKLSPRWSIPHSETGYAIPPKTQRSRAASDFRVPIRRDMFANKEHEWTWCGNDRQIMEFLRNKKKYEQKPTDLYKASFALPPPFFVNIDDPTSQNSTKCNESPSLLKRLNPFKKIIPLPKIPKLDFDYYNNQTIANSGFSRKPSMAERRASSFSIFSAKDETSANILENTTIADLIRALETMHTQAVTGPFSIDSQLDDTNRRSSAAGFNVVNNITQMNILTPAISQSYRIGDRRISMQPFSSDQKTPLAHRAMRRRSMFVENDTSSPRLTTSISVRPPPYTESLTATTPQRRFSVRPTLLSVPPGQSTMPSIQVTSSLQRKISSRPSPLLNDPANRTTFHHFHRSISNNSNNNYSTAPVENLSQLRSMIHNNLLTPVDESHINFRQNRRSSQVTTPAIESEPRNL